MKVEEAMTKVCPFMNGFSYFHDGTLNTSLIKCICGDCMAWQGMKEKEANTVGCKTGYFEDGKYLDKTDDNNAPHGYCSRLPQ